jgi:hypothetical protein
MHARHGHGWGLSDKNVPELLISPARHSPYALIIYLLYHLIFWHLFPAAQVEDRTGVGVGIEKYLLLALYAQHQFVEVIVQVVVGLLKQTCQLGCKK